MISSERTRNTVSLKHFCLVTVVLMALLYLTKTPVCLSLGNGLMNYTAALCLPPSNI